MKGLAWCVDNTTNYPTNVFSALRAGGKLEYYWHDPTVSTFLSFPTLVHCVFLCMSMCNEYNLFADMKNDDKL